MSKSIVYQFSAGPEGARFLEELDARLVALGHPKGKAIAFGLGLLKATLDAKQDGKAVGIAESPIWLETEFKGF